MASAAVSVDSYEKKLYQIMENINQNNENIFKVIEVRKRLTIKLKTKIMLLQF